MVKLHYVKGKKVTTLCFDTVKNAYWYYIENDATITEWLYYLINAHTLLCDINDEDIMRCLFKHLFKKVCLTEEESIDK